MRRIERIKWLTMMLLMMFMATACSDGGSDEDNSLTPEKPENPISDSDWEVVSAAGGTIEKGDISIDFPKGTFKKDTKVAVTKVKKGETCGNRDVSDFYQITTPITTYQPITVKIKGVKQSDDYCLVMNSLTYAQSNNGLFESNNFLETTYSNGEYTATLPVFENGDDNETSSYSVGLVETPAAKPTTRGLTKNGAYVREGMVGDIMWKLFIDTSVDKYANSRLVLTEENHDRIAQYIEESIQKIIDLGFKLKQWGNKNRTVPFYYVSDPDRYGAFQQSRFSDALNYISLGVEKMNETKDDPTQLKCTIIHELFHYFQADYNPRSSFDKGGGLNFFNFEYGVKWEPTTIDNESIIFEMASVWVEQFMNNGNLNETFLEDNFTSEVLKEGKYFNLLGFGEERKRWGQGIYSYQQQGYTMGPWLQYLTKEIKELDLKREQHPVLELFQLFNKKWKGGSNAYDIIKEWVKSYDDNLLGSYYIDDYYKKLWMGQLVKNFNIHNLLVQVSQNKIKDSTGKLEFDDQCYPFGCAVNKVVFTGFKDTSLENKELVIKQHNKNVRSFVLITDKSNYNNFRGLVLNGDLHKISPGDSIWLTGKTLESMRPKDAYYGHEFYIITTNTLNSIGSTKLNDSHVTVELRDVVSKATVSPNALTFKTGGGTKSVTVATMGYKYVGFDTPSSWLTVKANANNTIEITAQPNVTGKERSSTVKCYVTNADKPTEKDKVYLPVTVTQSGTPPSVSPNPLTFEAEGGMQTVKVNLEGYAYFGSLVDDADKSWLSRSNIAEGTIEVTAKPNTTGKERTSTIRCYVANVANAPESERVYIDINVKQKANATPSISPTSLTFEAEGGTQDLKITFADYSVFGSLLDDTGKSWLSREHITGGTVRVTAQPNTTSQKRETVLRCYVAKVKNAPESERYYMDVTITQKAGKEQTGTDKYKVAYGSVSMSIYTDIDGNNTMGEIYFQASDKFLTVTPKGKGLHFDINYKVNETDYSETLLCQFDIDDLSLLESKKSKVTNLSWSIDSNNKGGRSWAGVWAAGGWGWLVSQTQKIRFSTSSKIPQIDFDWGDGGTRTVNWFIESDKLSPSVCTYDRWSTTASEEVGVVVDKGKGMQEGSNIWINVHFNVVGD